MANNSMPHKSSKNPLVMYSVNPQGVSFENQESGEKIILFLRAHFITLLPAILQIIIIFILPFFTVPILSLLRINFFDSLGGAQVFWIIVVWYLFFFGFSFYKFIFWYFNVYIVTNERIVDFDFRGILHKETAYANLSQIQDVTPKIIGFFGTYFHYGDVFIQTAAAKNEFDFHAVANPDDVARTILEEVRREEGESPGEIA